MNDRRDPGEDPWASVTTSTGLPADEVISTLQKSIRRGDVRNAVLCALDLAATSPELDTFLWDRLHVIAVEDVGFGNASAVAVDRRPRHCPSALRPGQP